MILCCCQYYKYYIGEKDKLITIMAGLEHLYDSSAYLLTPNIYPHIFLYTANHQEMILFNEI